MNINRMVIDLSHYETVQNYDEVRAAGIYGIIWKATQGTSFNDPAYWTERGRALKAGLLWGAYHFGDSSDIAQQAFNFVSFAKPLANELICLDLEDNRGNSMTLAQARNWVEAVEKELGRTNQMVIYSGNTIKEMLGDTVDPFWGARRLWLAQYGDTPTVQRSWTKPWLWQYTDGLQGPGPHEVPGIIGGIDCSSYDGLFTDLAAQWEDGGQTIPAPPTTDIPEVKIVISSPPGVKVTVVGP